MPFTFRQGDLPKLDLSVDRGTDFAAWMTQWESYCSLSGLADENVQKQCLKKVLIWKINTSIWFRWMKNKTSSLIEDKRKDKVQRTHTRQNPKRHIPLGDKKNCQLQLNPLILMMVDTHPPKTNTGTLNQYMCPG
ncbi:uncharacterized protein [Dysidea avara]|uniref:uncharacterized protein n=1 Tax=Dysidea avara TaxID=196820 RepID=UPI0033253073